MDKQTWAIEYTHRGKTECREFHPDTPGGAFAAAVSAAAGVMAINAADDGRVQVFMSKKDAEGRNIALVLTDGNVVHVIGIRGV